MGCSMWIIVKGSCNSANIFRADCCSSVYWLASIGTFLEELHSAVHGSTGKPAKTLPNLEYHVSHVSEANAPNYSYWVRRHFWRTGVLGESELGVLNVIHCCAWCMSISGICGTQKIKTILLLATCTPHTLLHSPQLYYSMAHWDTVFWTLYVCVSFALHILNDIDRYYIVYYTMSWLVFVWRCVFLLN